MNSRTEQRLPHVPVNTPLISEQDRQSVLDCLADGWISSEGPQVALFETALARACGRRQGVAVSSGTGALEIAVRALGLGAGDEVLVPSFTIISCGQAIVRSGATPIPVDCDPTDWNAHLHHFEARATPRTRALMLVHLYGLCADLDPILDWARERHLLVIEDASQAQGLRYNGRACGSFGDVSVFSLYANKLITTGEGGMLLCDSDEIASRCRSLRNLCFERERRFWHEDLGWNYRMTAIQAAFGLPQVGRLDALVAQKRAQGLAYHEAFRGNEALEIAPARTEFAENVFWVFGLVVASSAAFTRQQLVQALSDQGIATRPFFIGLHLQPALLKTGLMHQVSLPVTERLGASGMYLPGGAGLSHADQQRVIEAVQHFLRQFSR